MDLLALVNIIFDFGHTSPVKSIFTCVIPDNAIGSLSKITFTNCSFAISTPPIINFIIFPLYYIEYLNFQTLSKG